LIVLILDKIWRFLNNLVIFEKYNWTNWFLIRENRSIYII
jgi:hypothetical protein